MSGFEILDRGCAPQVEDILSDTKVASGVPLAGGDVREGVFDLDPLAEGLSSRSRLLKAAKPLLESLVFCDRTERPRPDAALVHLSRCRHAPQASGSNSTVLPGSKVSTSPAGHVIVLARRSSLKSRLVNRVEPARTPHGLAKTRPPAPRISSTTGALT